MNRLQPGEKALIDQAFSVRAGAYAPYSGMAVGAALLAADGRVFSGCNMENAAYAPTLCAERAAFAQAVTAGCRDFLALAIAGGPQGAATLPAYFWPCGVCRQVMAEFCGPDFRVIAARSKADFQIRLLSQLLPEAFGPASLTHG